MRLNRSLPLAALGLLFITTTPLNANASDVDSPSNEQFVSSSYLSPFADDDDPEVPFELVDDGSHLKSRSNLLAKRSNGCSSYHTVKSSDTCSKISAKYKISLDDFYDWNSQVNSKCTNLYNGKKYCVKHSGSSSSKSSSTKRDSSKKNKKSSSKGSSEKRKKLQSKSAFTYYWIAQPNDYSKGGRKVTVKTCNGKSIGKVSEKYADALVMEGTGVVGSKIVNLGGCSCSGYKCFETVDKEDDPYGLTSFGSPLRPYVTIASNDIKKNTKVFVPELEGWTLPGTKKKHNGCLLVDDQSWSFDNHHIDFYVYAMKNYKTLDKKHGLNKVTIYEGGSCKLLNYLD